MQRMASSSETPNKVPPIVHEVLRSPGQPLDAAARDFMEPRFGHDFSGVRVHADAKAAESARATNALAYTVGREVVFDAGQFAPHTYSGRMLLAHELAHVVQQQSAGESAELRTFRISEPGDTHEREADAVAATVVRNGPAAGRNEFALSGLPGQLMQRQPAPGQSNNACAGWESDPQSFSKVIADFYYSTELGGAPSMADIQCQGDNRLCFVTYPDGTSIGVSLARVPNFVIARQRGVDGGPRREYVYDCEASGRVNLRPR
jgi:hypothetical protein